MSTQVYTNGVLRQQWDDATRVYTEYDAAGNTTLTRAYGNVENTAADALVVSMQLDANRATIEQALADALASLQVIIDDTNANINTNPAQRIKDEARALKRVIRLLTRRFDAAT